MDIAALSEKLSVWLRVDTWHTGHPMDDQRFHRALKSVFDSLGVQISSENFREAITEALTKSKPNGAKAYLADIEKFAQRAEDIASYLHDLPC